MAGSGPAALGRDDEVSRRVLSGVEARPDLAPTDTRADLDCEKEIGHVQQRSNTMSVGCQRAAKPSFA